MCDWRPGLRCSTHAMQRAAMARGVYTAAHPDGPAVHPLTGELQTLAELNAERVIARRTVRLATAALRGGVDGPMRTTWLHLRDRALTQDAVALERMQGIRAAREATRAEELAKLEADVEAEVEPDQAIPDGFNLAGFDGVGRHYLTGTFRDPQGYDAQGRDARGADRTGWLATGRHVTTGTRFDPDGYGADGYHRRTGFDRLGYHRSTGTQYDLQGRTLDDVTGVGGGEGAAVAEVAPVDVPMAPAVKRLALYAQWDRPDDLLTPAQVQDVLGVDETGLAELERSGRLPAAIEERVDAWPQMYRFDRVLELAGPLPAPGAMTRVAAREHTLWKRTGERASIAAWRELEARKNRAA